MPEVVEAFYQKFYDECDSIPTVDLERIAKRMAKETKRRKEAMAEVKARDVAQAKARGGNGKLTPVVITPACTRKGKCMAVEASVLGYSNVWLCLRCTHEHQEENSIRGLCKEACQGSQTSRGKSCSRSSQDTQKAHKQGGF